MQSMLVFLLLSLRVGAYAASFTVIPPCDDKLHAKRAKELESLEAADQADREGDISKIDWKKVGPRDLKRRKKALEIFAEGCFTTADDYFNAALIFQHGSVPDHIFQAYVWASKAAQLQPEHSHARSLSQAALDRFLMDSGYKQVYGTQASKNPAGCYCLWPVEVSMTDDMRARAGAQTLDAKLKWLTELNKGDPNCRPSFCPSEAKPVVKGALPGVAW